MPDKSRMTPVKITEADLKQAVEDCVEDFDTPPPEKLNTESGVWYEAKRKLMDAPPGPYSKFEAVLAKMGVFVMSKEIPAMVSVQNLHDLTLEDVGLLAFLGCLPEIGDADPEMASDMIL